MIGQKKSFSPHGKIITKIEIFKSKLFPKNKIILRYYLNGPCPASFSLFSSFQYSWQWMLNTKMLPMTGFVPRTSGFGSDRSTNWGATTAIILGYLGGGFEYVKEMLNEWNKERERDGRRGVLSDYVLHVSECFRG